ncbi:NAD(P)/FAD-dependent oxidoreductase [Caulobacter endophyticus]|uniref:Thioredoxin reductase n=1 Tax=Caulobacter endophyticus TaxID=2172652 RepID=A0A2T9JGZ0_9CAUL|nr:NAD(P)/FAD-dependent oxidoreductase [Caulobacter endophyticus]PVM82948.1 NAD(P)/FAD-dependent oxidoreductase [Caulobacter endophyticus]
MRYDAIVVGAGPAGLTAATYLGRFRRRVLVLDGGEPRANWIPESHNTPGFPDGVGGPALLSRLRRQAELYGATTIEARADSLARVEECFEVALDGSSTPVKAPFVLLATGVVDRKPDIDGIDEAVRRALVRICPICDAYEAIDQRIAVLGDGPLGAREALFLKTYSDSVTLLHQGSLDALPDVGRLLADDVGVMSVTPADIRFDEAVQVSVDGRERTFDCLYLALGCEMQSRLAVRWGAAHDDGGNLIVDRHQQTSIDGLYAAGDVVRGLNQITVATAEAAIAAADIHRRLREA